MAKMRQLIKSIAKGIVSVFPVRNVIVLQTCPPFTDNTMAVFNEMLKRGLNKKYKIVWTRVDKSKPLPHWENVYFLDENSFIDNIKSFYYRKYAK